MNNTNPRPGRNKQRSRRLDRIANRANTLQTELNKLLPPERADILSAHNRDPNADPSAVRAAAALSSLRNQIRTLLQSP